MEVSRISWDPRRKEKVRVSDMAACKFCFIQRQEGHRPRQNEECAERGVELPEHLSTLASVWECKAFALTLRESAARD